MSEVRSPVCVGSIEPVGNEQVTTEIASYFPLSREGILIAIENLDNAHSKAREQLVGFITERNT